METGTERRQERGTFPGRDALVRALFEGALGFALGCAEPFGGCAPFGISFCAGATPGMGGFCCLLGTLAGYLLSRGLDRGIRCAAASMLSFTTAFVFRDTPALEHRWFLSAAAGLITLICGTLAYFEGSALLLTTARLLAETLLAALCCRPFALLRRKKSELTPEERESRSRGVLLSFGCTVMALCRIPLWGELRLGWFPAVFAVLLWAWAGGGFQGSAAGVLLGLCCGLNGAGQPVLTLSCALGGLLGGALREKGRAVFAAGFTLGFALPLLGGESPFVSPLFALCGALPVFLFLPREKLSLLSERLVPWEGEGGESLLRLYGALRTGELARCLGELCESAARPREEEEEEGMSAVYDRAAESVCAVCLRKELCWHAEYMSMLSGLNDATEVVRRRGKLSLQELPPRFRESCVHPEAFLQAVNGELRNQSYRRQLRARLEEHRSAAYGQLRALSAVLAAQARELGEEQRRDADMEKSVNRYLHVRAPESRASAFRDGRGRVRILLEGDDLPVLLRREGTLSELSELTGIRLCRVRSGSGAARRALLTQRERYSASVGIAAERKMGESISGDRGTWFTTEQGFLYLLLSDGMGSGEEAAREAVGTVRSLEKLLGAGVGTEEALRLVNGLMLLRNGESWAYATIDLVCVDLLTGEVCFHKFGAAPSYVNTQGEVKRVRGVSLAAGILSGENEERELLRTVLQPGDTVLLCSDGVASEQDDGWIRERLQHAEGDGRQLAAAILDEAVKRYGRCDDMTVLALRLQEGGM